MSLPLDARQQLLDALDDQGACDVIISLLQIGHDTDNALRTLWEPWVLQRLRTVKDRAPHVYFGSFLSPLRRLFPRQVFPPDIEAAMRGADAAMDPTPGDVPPADFEAEALAVYDGALAPGCSPGWSNVAQHYTVRPGEMTIITGVASHMKSTWVQALCVNLARHHRWQFGVFSPEHYPLGTLASLLLQNYTGVSMAQMPREMFVEVIGWVPQHFHCITATEAVPPTLPWLLAVARLQVARYGIKGLLLDPWNEVEHAYGRQSETQYISDSLSKVRRFARQHGVHVWIVAHPTKLQKAEKGPYAGKYPPPTPYDISGSAHWYNKADNCISVWRDVWEDSAEVQLHFQKIRNRFVGKPGLVTLTYTGQQFTEADPDESDQWHY